MILALSVAKVRNLFVILRLESKNFSRNHLAPLSLAQIQSLVSLCSDMLWVERNLIFESFRRHLRVVQMALYQVQGRLEQV